MPRHRRDNVYITDPLSGETLTVSQWARRLGISRQALMKRKNLGWDALNILYTDVRDNTESRGGNGRATRKRY